jgi:hypothetical protein
VGAATPHSILHQRSFFHDVTPVNFNTFATPHIGLLKYPSLISSVFSSLGPKLLSRTGEQFYGVDKWGSSQQPLIEVMADPDRIFWQALALFPHIRIYANAVNDVTVPFITASISTSDPFLDHNMNGIQMWIFSLLYHLFPFLTRSFPEKWTKHTVR